MKLRLRRPSFLALAAILLAFPPAAAQREAEYEDDGIRQAVARLSYFEGEVSFNRGDDPDDWQPASVNYPMTVGDRVWAGREARVELQLRGGTIYLGPESELAALDLTPEVRQLSLALGTASFRVHGMERDEVFEVGTPNLSVTFEAPGLYRIDVDEEGNSRVSVLQGRANAAAAGGQVQLERGDQIRVQGIDRPWYDVVGLSRSDSFDRWVENRARRYRSVRSAAYVHADIYGVDDLDAYGTWEESPEYGFVWYPRGLAAGWEPYRLGRWIWRDPWGWTWLSSEPWGWAPYHYGRWALARGRWCWVPVGPGRHHPGYSPALVGFVGGGPGWAVSIAAGGFVGWFPLGPLEPFAPWWHRSRSRPVPTDYRYAYRDRVTVVPNHVFVGGGRIDRDLVRDPGIVREISAAPVLRGPVPVLPTRDSIRAREVDVPGRGDMRPPARLAEREVVTRIPPPPAPPSFDRKLDLIRDRGGEPVSTDVARRLSTEERAGGVGTRPVRPAARDEVLLAPRGEVKDSYRPQPLPPSGGRPPVTTERPRTGRDEVPPTPVPEPWGQTRTTRPTATPRRFDVQEEPPVRERTPAPWPGFRREPEPTRPTPDAWPPRREPTRPPSSSFERPTPVPTLRVERMPVQQTRPERTEPRSLSASPDRAEPRKAEPDRVESKPKPAPTPTPTPKKGRGRPDREAEPGKTPG